MCELELSHLTRQFVSGVPEVARRLFDRQNVFRVLFGELRNLFHVPRSLVGGAGLFARSVGNLMRQLGDA